MCSVKKDEGGFLHILMEKGLNQIMNQESPAAE